MSDTPAPKSLRAVGNFIDDRFHLAKTGEKNLRKVFPNHWSFMLGEIALYSFIILLLTGVFLTLWFKPSMTEIVYDGSYERLNGVLMSEAYASTLHITFDVRGGLLMRQIHHWAALIFVASMTIHMLRVFFTGAFRKPREINWTIGAIILLLSFVEGLFGYSLPDDLPSGMGVRILQGVILSIPVIGTYVMMFLFGGEFPGEDIIPRLYMLHILLIPGILLALIVAHFMILWHQKHTQYPGTGRTEKKVVGTPMYPAFAVKAGGFFFFTFAVIVGLSAFVQINPIHLFGPFTPTSITSGLQPDWYMGFMEGALRIFPNWFDFNIAGYAVPVAVLVPGLGSLGLLAVALIAWPWIEQWITRDREHHNVADRPRNAPTRTALGVAASVVYGLLWLAGSNDIISETFSINLYLTTWIFRVGVIVGPVVAFIVTKRICLGLQRRDRETLEHGYESGTIEQLPSGEFIEVHKTSSPETVHVLRSKRPVPRIDVEATDEEGVESPEARSVMGRLRNRLAHWYTKDNISFEGVEPHSGHHLHHGHATAGAEQEPANTH
ncbi:cytochrome bc1 complex cytochrome b subunit [Marinitenerispora sediminis]|uniref:Cytochrome bc1 complex cytochrome b subunit n=1 Tax=Marinitenerispora sediminis TaxID=1931232 RepID=A0A368T753_9ACTN|nr:cytochrome bc complex cytochrome b subunit [Marinitenerispora sediminis]RCV54138.1 ubiquinol-cytochrome c reductase cytochrome b subunit [Marinitenerispora sediminis]RCV56784.1 ubiquinol-cytochrome c reductase cytochrome b subunit [Marinitenerispora sediminis]RCV59631.1 ubiquinol-cytochrome c reductase cytochrome b subunit [Marinitenerispora sediminis]